MTIEKKLLGTSPSGDAANVAEVFSTFLYTGTGSNQTINNGIDLSGEGGLTWIKGRDAAYGHNLYDTERGVTNSLASSSTSANAVKSDGLTSFNNNGFTLGSSGSHNTSTKTYASWTFRKKKKFFTCLTYSGSGSAKTVAHNLESVPAMVLIKSTNASSNWRVYHSGMGATKAAQLNNNEAAQTNTAWFNDTAPTDSVFTVGVGSDMNASGRTYIAYLFADNSSEDADDQMIKCGGVTGTGSAGLEVNLGWEPQFVIIKNTSRSSEWMMVDTMRGMSNYGWRYLLANDNSQESGVTDQAMVVPTATGFTINNNGGNDFGQSGDTLIYCAIRSEMMVEPETATEVFGMSNAMTQPLPAFNSTFPVDMSLNKRPAYSQNNAIGSRLQGTKHLYTDISSVEVNEVEYVWDFMDGWGGFNSSNSDYQSWNWKRAKSYMDVVSYSGTGAGRTQAHSLGVVPEMIWLQCRNATEQWGVYSTALGNTKYLQLHTTSAPSVANFWNNTSPTDSVFSLGSIDEVNGNNKTYIAFLFATLDGISKCGSYTGNGSYQTISCGFSAGSRFVLIKRTDAAGDWYYWDSVRGIVAGNDPHLSLNSLAAQVTSDDSIDPANSGFIVNQVAATNINVSSGTYIFYAIAQDNQL